MRARLAIALALLAVGGCKKDDAPAHLELARTALFERKADVALSEYKLALDRLERDSSPEALVYKARALRGAADTYYFHLRDYQHAMQVYRELITLCPEAPETLEGRVHLASLMRDEFRDLRGSIAELTAALARNPPQSAEIAYQVAEMYFELQDYEQCEIEARGVAQKFETSAFVDDALFLRAQALSMMEDRKLEAQRALTDLIDRFPESELKPHALFELGRLKADRGESERAIELWVEALKRHPDPNIVQNNIARVRARLRATTPKNVGDAVSAFDWDKYPVTERAGEGGSVAARPPPKTSIEAVGGTPEEAEREAKMRGEPGAEPQKALPPQGEGSL